MNILMFNYEYPPLGGGGGVANEMLAEALAHRHRVVVVTSGMDGLPAEEVREGVEIRRVPVVHRHSRAVASLPSMLSYPPAAWRETWGLLRRESFDIVNGQFAVPTGPASLPMAKLAGVPHVLTIYGGDIYDPSKRLSPHRSFVLRQVVRRVLVGSHAVVAESENTRENALRYYRFDGPIELIPLGIRIPPLPEVDRRALGLPPDRFILITVGRLVSRKAVDRLIGVVDRVRDRPVHLVVVGAGPEEDPLRRLVDRLGLSDRVSFTGFVEEERKWELLRAADAYVSTSLHEGFGLVFLEAMAMGLPVVAPDHGGQVDFLVDGETGFVTPAGDEEAVADALSTLVDSPDLARRMGEANRERAEQYRFTTCAERYEALFRRIVEAAGSVGPSGRGESSWRSDSNR